MQRSFYRRGLLGLKAPVSPVPGCLVFSEGLTWTEGPSLPPLFAEKVLPLFDICPEAQQAVVSALNSQHLQEQKVILCHSPGEIQSTGLCSLGTHDLFRELIEDKREDFVSVFPNIHTVVNYMRKMQINGFSFEVVLSCHEKCDLIGLLAELIEKFAGGHKFIHSVKSLCRLPKKALKPHPTLTYVVGLQSDRCSQIDIHWNGELKKSDDLSFPKTMFALDTIQDILGKKSRLLSSFRTGRNGRASYDGSNNSKTIPHDAYKRSSSQYSREFEELIQVLFQEAKRIPLQWYKSRKLSTGDGFAVASKFLSLCFV